uniref:AlNc14C438G11641 protein n=1 Tax=Albugo laibachii Nc14 TaxID=890382 RepID=F0WZQ1_9STRA|nr:AlNc14C438G11641 [Albugo laibachii Nc14]|eukprot:CCA26977.1 AlNc14C438G11641 [Albugo laibachii Nc14]
MVFVDESAYSDASETSKNDTNLSDEGNHFADSVKMNDLIISLLECTQAAKERRQALKNASALSSCLALQRDSIHCMRSMMGMTSKQHPFAHERSLRQVAIREVP